MGFLRCLRSIELFDLCAAYIDYLIINSGQFGAEDKGGHLLARQITDIQATPKNARSDFLLFLVPGSGQTTNTGAWPAVAGRSSWVLTSQDDPAMPDSYPARPCSQDHDPRPAAGTTGNLSPSCSDQDTAGLSAAGAASYRERIWIIAAAPERMLKDDRKLNTSPGPEDIFDYQIGGL